MTTAAAGATTTGTTTTTAAAGATTTTAGTTTTGTTTTATTAPVAFDWNAAGMDAGELAFVNERGWKSPKDQLTSYRNLEKLTGVPPEQIIKLPKDLADPSMGEVWTRLGKPASAADYKLEAIAGSDAELSKIASGWFHEANAPASVATKVVQKWNEHVAELNKKATADFKAKTDAEALALKAQWGAKHDTNVEIAKTAAKAFGITEQQLGALESAMGFAGVHKFLHSIGSKLGEAEFVQGGGKPSEFSGMTVEGAKAKITELKKDNNFIARWNSKDPVVKGEARAEMARYEKVAYPGQVTI